MVLTFFHSVVHDLYKYISIYLKIIYKKTFTDLSDFNGSRWCSIALKGFRKLRDIMKGFLKTASGRKKWFPKPLQQFLKNTGT